MNSPRKYRDSRSSVPGEFDPRAMGLVPACVWTAIALIAPALAFGGAFPWGVAIACACAAIAAASATTFARANHEFTGIQFFVTSIDLVFVLGTAWTIAGRIPLPMAWVESVRPSLAEAWARNAAASGIAPPSFVPLSLDPGATTVAIAASAALLTAYFVARVLRVWGFGRFVVRIAASASLTIAAIGFLHALARTDAVYGLYTPVFAQSRLLTPLMNENHAAALTGLGAVLFAGLALHTRSITKRRIDLACVAVCAAACIATMSRSGVISLIGGLCTFGALALFIPRFLQLHTVRANARTSAVVFVALLVAFAVWGTPLATEFGATRNVGKSDVVLAGANLVPEHLWLGAGRGAFSALSLKVDGFERRLTHPENIVVQLATEWGVVVAMIVLLAAMIALTHSFRNERRLTYIAAIVGLAWLGIHDLADFSTELVGVGVIAAALLGTVAPRQLGVTRIPLATAVLASAIFAIVGTALAVSMHTHDVYSRQMIAQHALEAGRLDEAERSALAGIEAHPMEPVFALQLAELHVMTDAHTAAPWIARALQLAPHWSAPHLIAAKWLYTTGHVDQSMLELREAERHGRGSAREVVCLLRRAGLPAAQLIRAAPKDDLSQLSEFITRSATCKDVTDASNLDLDAQALTVDPGNAVIATRVARRALAAHDYEGVLTSLALFDTPTPTMRALRAHANAKSGDTATALTEASAVIRDPDSDSDAIVAAARAAIAAGHPELLALAHDRLRVSAAGNGEALAHADLVVGKLFEQANDFEAAFESYEAARRRHESVGALKALHRVAKHTGREEVERDVAHRLCALRETAYCNE